MAPVITCTPAGLSPRVRGTRPAANPAGVRRRIIPARAGNTRWPASSPRRGGDHPRVCGEHLNAVAGGNADTGSSPRVRGTPSSVTGLTSLSRIIPACAGNTRKVHDRGRNHRDHPHVCGEHRSLIRIVQERLGSSPRVRGTRLSNPLDVVVVGIIPACAGNTLRTRRRCVSSWDHPRVCGEHGWWANESCVVQGSSPRVRGTRTSSRIYGRVRGIIPACAGNTEGLNVHLHLRRDHPRVCGEHNGKIPSGAGMLGSSPRARGTQARLGRGDGVDGIIPACAGNTEGLNVHLHLRRDHPRVCGEHATSMSSVNGAVGSSPRVRGTQRARAFCA